MPTQRHDGGILADDLGIAGRSLLIEGVRADIRRFAPFRFPVLILGETGTGKELIAKALRDLRGHQQNYRAVNCSAFPESLLESELFGHEKGAFTGATRQKRGLFEQCNGGTLFLDEIGDLPLALQAKFLRVLQEKEFYRIGGQELVTVDVRVIAATHQGLPQRQEAGTFRADLYHRLSTLVIRVPPLRDRLEDIEDIAEMVLPSVAQDLGRGDLTVRVAPSALTRLQLHHWPGNVRELQGVLIRSVINQQIGGETKT